MVLEKLSPILPARDLTLTEAFWSRLGFTTFYMDPAEYLMMERDGAEVHFFADHDLVPAQNNHGAYLRPSDVSALDAEWSGLSLPREGIPRYVPLEEKPWDMAELAVIDPDGNLVRAGQEMPLG